MTTIAEIKLPSRPLLRLRDVKDILRDHGLPCYNQLLRRLVESGELERVTVPGGVRQHYKTSSLRAYIERVYSNEYR